MTREIKRDDPADMTRGRDSTLKKLRSRDKVGVAGDALGALVGMLAGVFGAGVIAAVLGLSTFLGSTFLAKWLGGIFVTKTPTSVIVGAAVVGAILGLWVARLVRSGARHDKIADGIADRIEAKEDAARTTPGGVDVELSSAIDQAVAQGLLSEMDRQRLLELTVSGQMSVQIALARVRGVLSEGTDDSVSENSGDSAEAEADSSRKSVSEVTQAGLELAKSGADTLAAETRQLMDEAKGKVESGLLSAGRFLKAKIAAATRSEKKGG